jgi:hypothetical protein
MSDTPDLDELAERYLDLWQDQMSALASDPEFAEVMNRLLASSAAAMPDLAAAWAAWPAMMAGLGAGKRTEDGKDAEQTDGGPGAAPTGRKGGARAAKGAPRAEAAAAAPGDRRADLVELARRLAALEDRVAALESGPGQGRGGARGRPRKSRT